MGTDLCSTEVEIKEVSAPYRNPNHGHGCGTVLRPAYLAGGSPIDTVEIDKADTSLRYKKHFRHLACADTLVCFLLVKLWDPRVLLSTLVGQLEQLFPTPRASTLHENILNPRKPVTIGS